MTRIVDHFHVPANVTLEQITQHYASEGFERSLFNKMGLNVDKYQIDGDRTRTVSGNKFNLATFSDIRTQPSPTSLHYERLGAITGAVDIDFQSQKTQDGLQEITRTVNHSLKSNLPFPGINAAIHQGFVLAKEQLEADLGARNLMHDQGAPLN